MTRGERLLCVAGLGLFLLALLQGFFIPRFERVDAARAAHVTALGSGTFLIAVGLMWPKLSVGAGAAALSAALLAASLYAIAIGLTVSATYPVDGANAHPYLVGISSMLNVAGALALIVEVIAVLLACWSAESK